jgi:hypothetical protein
MQIEMESPRALPLTPSFRFISAFKNSHVSSYKEIITIKSSIANFQDYSGCLRDTSSRAVDFESLTTTSSRKKILLFDQHVCGS